MPASNPWISLFKAPIWVSSLLIFGVDLTSSAVIQAANQPANLNLPSLTLPLNGTDERWHCSRSQDWLTSTFDGNDCFEVIEKFANIEEKAHGQSKYEFLAPFAHTDHHSLKPQATPRRYKSGTCVMQIVMLSDPVLGNLDGRDVTPGAYASTDVSNYHKLWNKGLELSQICLRNFGIPGLITAGEDNSIGVFLWAANSAVDKRVNELPPSVAATS